MVGLKKKDQNKKDIKYKWCIISFAKIMQNNYSISVPQCSSNLNFIQNFIFFIF